MEAPLSIRDLITGLLLLVLPATAWAQTYPTQQFDHVILHGPGSTGDVGGTSTTATGSSAARALADRAADSLNPADYGAIMDGTSHPLSGRYSTLAAAQAVCPEATALTQEIDWCAMQAIIDHVQAMPVQVTGGAFGQPGAKIRIPNHAMLYTGADSLNANNISLSIQGEDGLGSGAVVKATPWLNFGTNNKIGVGSAVVSSTGTGFSVGDQLTLTGGTCATPPVIGVLTVGTSGEILSNNIPTPGSCATPPSNPLAYSTAGNGTGAVMNGTFPGSALTAISFQGTGSGCVVGETLTATGGVTPGGSPTPAKLTVTTVTGGAVQRGGTTVAAAGAYGTPPPNPVSFTGSAACSGATFNIGQLTNPGGRLTIDNASFVAAAPHVSIAKAQFNLTTNTVLINNITYNFIAGTGYWGWLFDLTSVSGGVFNNVDGWNDVAHINDGTTLAMFIIRAQNNMLGHYEHRWTRVNATGFNQGAIDYQTTDEAPFQGLYFDRVACGYGSMCLNMENTGHHGYGNIMIHNFYATQSAQQIAINLGINVVITDSAFGGGTNRLATQPPTADGVLLNGVNNGIITNNACAGNNAIVPAFNCFHLAGTSYNNVLRNNTITNAARIASFTAYLFDSGTNSNTQLDAFRIAPAFVNYVTDNGTNNVTQLNPTINALASGVVTFGNAGGPSLQVANNPAVPRYLPSVRSGASGQGAYYSAVGLDNPTQTTSADAVAGSTTISLASTFGVIAGLVVTGSPFLPAAPALVNSVTTNSITLSAPTSGGTIPSGTVLSFSDYAVDINMQPGGTGAVITNGARGATCLTHTLVAAEVYTIPDGTGCIYFLNGLIASATIIMPANARPNQDIEVTWFSGVTTLTMQANTGQVMGGGTPTTASNATPFRWRVLSGRWQRMQ
jgi:hypothetical protein